MEHSPGWLGFPSNEKVHAMILKLTITGVIVNFGSPAPFTNGIRSVNFVCLRSVFGTVTSLLAVELLYFIRNALCVIRVLRPSPGSLARLIRSWVLS